MAAERSASERLRARLVRDLRAQEALVSPAVHAAFRAVPRERFIPQVLAERGVEAVYRDEAIVTKRDAQGIPISSSSQPRLMARMLELLAIRPGDRVLEIGAGTGYNAALLAHLAGPRGRVTTIDIDPVIARAARRALRAGDHRATVKVGDGRHGWPAGAPYDRIVVTACADEISRAWFDQLADGGRIELPLRLDPDGAAIQLIPVLERQDGHLRSVGLTWGGFMPLHGGDGGLRMAPSGLSATRVRAGKPTPLVAIAGAGLDRLAGDRARRLLAAALDQPGPPRRRGMTDMAGAAVPLFLIFLLLRIPPSRRISLSGGGRLGVGVLEPRSRSLAIISAPTPWTADAAARRRRVAWRLDGYGGDAAAAELEHLVSEWQQLRRARRTRLELTVRPANDALALSFAWTY